jgi:isopentenyl phosphate kinase
MKLLKLGGSIITMKEGWRVMDQEMVEKLAKVVARVWKKSERDWILVLGAGSCGHPYVVEHDLDNGVKNAKQKLGFAETHLSCSELNSMVTNELIFREKIPAISIPTAIVITSKNKRIHSFNTKIIDDYLQAGYLPVLSGDMVPDIELGGSVCSGDQIISYLGKKADKIILATNVDGVLDDKGKVIPKITIDNFEEISKHFKKPKTKDVTGAMAGKIKELLGLETPSYIVNGLKTERLERLMLGEKVECTEIQK